MLKKIKYRHVIVAKQKVKLHYYEIVNGKPYLTCKSEFTPSDFDNTESYEEYNLFICKDLDGNDVYQDDVVLVHRSDSLRNLYTIVEPYSEDGSVNLFFSLPLHNLGSESYENVINFIEPRIDEKFFGQTDDEGNLIYEEVEVGFRTFGHYLHDDAFELLDQETVDYLFEDD